MSDNIYQNDFFGDDLQERKKVKMRVLSDYSKQRYLPYMKIPIEYTVMIAIGAIVVVMVAYAIGVQVGRSGRESMEVRAADDKASKTKDIEKVLDDIYPDVPVLPQKAEAALEDVSKVDRITDLGTEAADPYEGARKDYVGAPPDEDVDELKPLEVPPAPTPTVLDSTYIVQLAAFSDAAKAAEAAENLIGKGVDARVARKGSWHQVYASGYDTIEEARKARSRFQGTYPDCYIRKIK
jgi:hypothetical protein